MSQEKLDKILEGQTNLLAKVSRIEGALYPDPGQPSRITLLEKRVGALEIWRSGLAGAWAILTAGATFLIHRK